MDHIPVSIGKEKKTFQKMANVQQFNKSSAGLIFHSEGDTRAFIIDTGPMVLKSSYKIMEKSADLQISSYVHSPMLRSHTFLLERFL